jgi:ATP-dependent protease HslVU (ClpYQ) ATPase subunit
MKAQIDAAVEERILGALLGGEASEVTRQSFRELYRCVGQHSLAQRPCTAMHAGWNLDARAHPALHQTTHTHREGELDERSVELEVPPSSPSSRVLGGGWSPGDSTMQEMVQRVDRLFSGGRGRGEKRRMKVSMFSAAKGVGGWGVRLASAGSPWLTDVAC